MDKPWVILVSKVGELGGPIYGISRRKTTRFSREPGQLRRFPTREAAERHLRFCVDRETNRCYTVTTL